VTVAPDSPEILQRFKSALDIVAKMARQMRRTVGSNINVEELESCGREGLLDAARRYDPQRRVPFRSYACVRIRGAMIDGVRRLMPLSRRNWQRLRGLESIELLNQSLTEDLHGSELPVTARSADEILSAHLAAMATAMAAGMLHERASGDSGEPLARDDDDPEEILLRRELSAQFERAIPELPGLESELVRRHYLNGERFDHVASSLGLSKSWASRLHRRAMDRLAKRLRELHP
jgi:RNA polymerase sigma factor for flagellar operon FliA